MKTILGSLIFLLMTTLIVGAQDEQKEILNTPGTINLVDDGANVSFTSDAGETYYVYVDKIEEQLKPHAGKRVHIKGTAKPVKNGNRKHIVWLGSAEPL